MRLPDKSLLSAAALSLTLACGHPYAPEASRADLRYLVERLAGAEYSGRESGTAQSRKAAQFIADYYADLGLAPAFGESFVKPFEFEAGVEIQPDNYLRFGAGDSAPAQGAPRIPAVPIPLGAPKVVTGAGVFLGFCIHAPEKGRDDFAGQSLKGKILFCLRYGPGGETNPALQRDITFEAKLKAAAKAEAAGVVFLNREGAAAIEPGEFHPRYSGPPALFLEPGALPAEQAWLREENQRMQAGETSDSGALGRAVGRVELSTAWGPRKNQGLNVGAWLRKPRPAERVVILGAHLDHLGRGYFSSLRGRGKIHYGADDNASGVAAVMEAAGALCALDEGGAASRVAPDTNVLFLNFDGEERGLFGSREFTKSDEYKALQPRVLAMINLDMVGRLRAAKGLSVQGAETADARWKAALESAYKQAGFPPNIELRFVPGGSGPSDHSAFYSQKTPIAFFFTGAHREYHTPDDLPATLNYDGLYQITRFAAMTAVELSRLDRPLVFQRATAEPNRSAFDFRVRLGIMPANYEGDGAGLEVGEVSPNAPVARTGLKSGDRIVRLGDVRIRDINDYMNFLSDARAGKAYRIEFKRGAQTLSGETTLISD